jgi:AcrR family transcriptional regulator
MARRATRQDVGMKPAQPSPPSRVARRKQRAREQLVAAAAEIIAAKGTEALRLREITDRADVGFGTFYTHFDSKEDLVSAVVRHTVETLTTSMLSRLTDVTDPALSAAMSHRWFIRLAVTDPPTAWLIVNLERADVMLEMAVHQDAEDALQRGIDSGRFRAMDTQATLTFAVGATISIMRGVLEGRLPSTADSASAEAFLCTLGVDPVEASDLAYRDFPAELDG